MDDLKKLLENAGINEAGYLPQPSQFAEMLSDHSRFYQFEISDEGIDVFVEEDADEDGTSTRWVSIARFPNLDDMLHEFGKM